jgi:hypothetical protein
LDFGSANHLTKLFDNGVYLSQDTIMTIYELNFAAIESEGECFALEEGYPVE